MVIDNVETFFQILRRLQLLAPEQIEELAREVESCVADPRDLAAYLVEVEWLTPYQGKALFEGDWDRLTVGPYQLLDQLGQGGVSEVFKAWDTCNGQIVALKVLRQHLVSSSDAVRQFQRELRAVTRLNHPNVIKTYHADQVGSMHYFAMEYVEGIDLNHYVQKVGPLPVEEACEYIRQVAQGLQHAHQSGLVHRDIKPANLFLINPPPFIGEAPRSMAPGKRADPLVKILDWGLARLRPVQGQPSDSFAGCDLESEQGALIGTADFIAPEQARDASLVDTRADLYSLGCTFYYLLTGQPPFPGNSLMQKLMRHQEAEPPSVRGRRADVPDEIDAMLLRLLAKRPEDRYQIPLLFIASLRPFCPTSGGFIGSVIRPLNGSTPRPASSSSLIPVIRPPSAIKIDPGK
jgi:serine/threonine-protein kinase